MIKLNLSRLLGERRMNQADLSRKTGIRPNTINALYRGYVESVKLLQLVIICDVLECGLHELMEYTPPMKKKLRK